MDKFELQNYVKEINAIATKNGVTPTDAVGMFVINLNAMRPFYLGADDLNFRELGQQWGSLPYREKNEQRAKVLAMVKKPATRPGRREE